MTTDRIIRKLCPGIRGMFRGSSLRRTGTLPLSSEALVAWALRDAFDAPVVFVTDGRQTLDLAHRDMESLASAGSAGRDALLYYPASETLLARKIHEDPEIIGYRMQVLQELAAGEVRSVVIATCAQALMQRTISKTDLKRQSVEISMGQDLEMDDVMEHATAFGYELSAEVNVKGQVCRRGGLIDIWPATEVWPMRIEFLGSTIESLRTFDPANQRSLEKCEQLAVVPLNEGHIADGTVNGSVLEYLPDNTLFIWSNADLIEQHAVIFEESAREAGMHKAIETLDDLQAELERRGARQVFTVSVGTEVPLFDFVPLSGLPDLRGQSFVPDLQESARQRLIAELMEYAGSGKTVNVYMETSGAEQHLRESLPGGDIKRFHVRQGSLSGGFMSDQLGLVVVAESDLYGRRQTRGQRYTPDSMRGGPEKIPATRISGLGDLEPGDLVIHVEHGLGKYLGLFDIEVNGKEQEVLTVEYADSAKLHIPVLQAHLLSRYAGVSPHQVRLHRLGGRRWNREIASADAAIMDLASSLLELQAERTLQNGYAFKADTTWQHEFEASFPYRETTDQVRAIHEVREDMEATKPMDRLICGDAGYGKTEVAMRAAFKAVMDAKQVVVLVPTTVLAQQHFDTFRERMSGYPVRIELLSRFRTQKERNSVMEGLATGVVDVVIGTHALLNPGIRLKDPGLVIIDEEQRFGVIHKERLKQLRRLVDVLTMTATPIPRTLYMSLTGARDVSLLQSPPCERMAIETIVAKDSDDVVRKALLHEYNREGQSFYLHNRVLTIDRVRQRLERLAPELRFGVAHGQMPSGELEAVMHAFVDGEYDVLICTTIIESGLDIPRVNTILIDRADRFGIADLYQLRGRVGRSNRKAYAYLLLPARGHIEPDARRRIAALQKFSGLSSGLNLAMRDLEIRGAGNLLGVSQSGHINAIGFGLYCQLLNRTIARLKNEPLPPVIDVAVNLDFMELTSMSTDQDCAATIPYSYIAEEDIRVEMYRRMAEAAAPGDIAKLSDELRDRFGPVPNAVNRLMKIAGLRIEAAQKGIVLVETRGPKLRLKDKNDFLMKNKRFPVLSAATPDRKIAEIVKLIRTVNRWRDA